MYESGKIKRPCMGVTAVVDPVITFPVGVILTEKEYTDSHTAVCVIIGVHKLWGQFTIPKGHRWEGSH